MHDGFSVSSESDARLLLNYSSASGTVPYLEVAAQLLKFLQIKVLRPSNIKLMYFIFRNFI